MAFSSAEERLAGKFDRANAAKTKQLEALYWILAVLEAPDDTIELDDYFLTIGEYSLEVAERRLEMIGQILRRRGISVKGMIGPIKEKV